MYFREIANLLPSPFGPDADFGSVTFNFSNKVHEVHFAKKNLTKTLILHRLNFSELQVLLKNSLAIIAAPESKKFVSHEESAENQVFLVLALGSNHRVYALSIGKNLKTGNLNFKSAYPVESDDLAAIFSYQSDINLLRDFEIR